MSDTPNAEIRCICDDIQPCCMGPARHCKYAPLCKAHDTPDRNLDSGGANPSFDTPDVLDVAFVERFATECMDPVVVGTLDGGFRHDPDIRGAERLLRKIVRGGYVLVKAPGLSHGDELVQVEIDPITGEIGTQAAWMRRSVPENGGGRRR